MKPIDHIDVEAGRPLLYTLHRFTPRFSEVDSMRIVWHGSYALYFEDAREAFGREHGLGYMLIFGNGYYAPLVELNTKFKRPITYGMECRVEIFYRPTAAAKIVFDYEIYDDATDELLATARSVQVFIDRDYRLVWETPGFYQCWKTEKGQC